MREVGAVVFGLLVLYLNWRLRTNHIHELTDPALRLAGKLGK